MAADFILSPVRFRRGRRSTRFPCDNRFADFRIDLKVPLSTRPEQQKIHGAEDGET
jgi:hypothetical protein